MSNRILDIAVVNHRLDPHETELRVHVEIENLTPTSEIRGKLTGPRCAYASTIEIAYPMREVERSGTRVTLRVVIPEASWWEPETPYLYSGAVELWDAACKLENVRFHHGIRMMQLTSKGLRLNSKTFKLNGTSMDGEMTEQKAIEYRNNDINAVLTQLPQNGSDAWTFGDRYGFFVLGTTKDAANFLRWAEESNRHASAFGWLLSAEVLESIQNKYQAPLNNTVLLGIQQPYANRPANADFSAFGNVVELDNVESGFPILLCDQNIPSPVMNRPDVIGNIKPS